MSQSKLEANTQSLCKVEEMCSSEPWLVWFHFWLDDKEVRAFKQIDSIVMQDQDRCPHSNENHSTVERSHRIIAKLHWSKGLLDAYKIDVANWQNAGL